MGYIEKTNYLQESKDILKDALIDLGADMDSNTLFRQYINSIDDIYNDFPKVTEEGTAFTLENIRKGKMVIESKGNTTQNITTGKNLLVYPYYSMPDTENFKFNSDGSIIINGTFTKTTNIMLRVQNQSIPNGDYSAKLWGGIKGSCYFVIGGSGSNVSYNESVFRTFTVTDNDCGYFFIQIPAGKTINNITVYPMLVSGTYTDDTMLEWEPYTGGIASPNPDYPQEIKNVTGNNTVKIKELLLPDEYQQVEYIESTQTQYINLNETASIDCEIGIDCYVTYTDDQMIYFRQPIYYGM